ncbi:hypothetical protein Ait01nite_059180 [Actinoplanes italicus]|uniref:Extracellular solute-binding protein n=1 Tax=Actinoplanes italicus TaxID=113567 RepID=A0A2T0K6T8_9ACTN|nr:substrate-binding domain-containing protein [Actinoplanes italicus]PRX18534.1 extracellular solute-binding protein [Actinoplanes italicus]GIE32873.1 hypothetical protein Ait01nite_059180 [Actinoplanes italicus]
MRGLTAVLMGAVLVLGGCAGDGAVRDDGSPRIVAPTAGSGDGGTSAAPGGGVEVAPGLVTLRVLADESLREVLGTVEQGFEAHHPNIEVALTYAEGGNLARRIAGGESGDVFATDDLFAMRTVTDAVRGTDPAEEFGGGRLTVIVLPAAAEPEAAAAFVDFLREGAGQRILIDSGVERP